MLSHYIRHLLLLLLEIILIVPAPLLNKVVNDELDTPTRLFVNLVHNCEYLFLLRA